MKTKRLGVCSLAVAILASCGKGKPLASVDWTESMHHRVQAGLFLPSREPVVCSVEQGKTLLPSAPVMMLTEMGSIAARTSDDGLVVFFFLGGIANTHPRLSAPCGGSLLRSFAERPRFPVRVRQPRAEAALSALRNEAGPPLLVGDLLDELKETTSEIEIGIIDSQGQPVPYGLLALQTEDVGGVAYQTDSNGRIRIAFARDWTAADAKISVLRLPMGQDLTKADFKDVATLVDGWTIRYAVLTDVDVAFLDAAVR